MGQTRQAISDSDYKPAPCTVEYFWLGSPAFGKNGVDSAPPRESRRLSYVLEAALWNPERLEDPAFGGRRPLAQRRRGRYFSQTSPATVDDVFAELSTRVECARADMAAGSLRINDESLVCDVGGNLDRHP